MFFSKMQLSDEKVEITSITLFSYLLKGVKYFIPSDLLDMMETKLNYLKDYRHTGDLRYLTDVQDGQYSQTNLISNPNALDQLEWFWKSILVGMPSYPVKSHSMALYRKKLRELVKARYLATKPDLPKK